MSLTHISKYCGRYGLEAKLMERFGMETGFLSTPYMNQPGEGDTDMRWYAGYLRSKDSQLVINYDLAWAFASILAVWVRSALSTHVTFVQSKHSSIDASHWGPGTNLTPGS
jgi:hypothetical protein